MQSIVGKGFKVKFLLLLSIAVLFFCVGKYFEKSEAQIDIEKIAKNMKDGEILVYEVDNSEKICFQSPYVAKDEFEKLSDEVIRDFKKNKNDAEFGMHIFSKNKKHFELVMGDSFIRLDYGSLDRPCKMTKYISMRKFRGFVLVSFSLEK